MAIALVASHAQYLDILGGTTTPINTTGGDLIVVGMSWYAANLATISTSDSKGNTWIPLTTSSSATGTRLFYAKNAICGTGHTFTWTASANSWIGITVFVFSGSDLSAPFDLETGAADFGATTLASGSITPSMNGCAIVSSASAGDGTITATPAGMTAVGAAAYVIQTTAAAINPSWSRTGGSQGFVIRVAAFKPAVLSAAANARVTQSVVEILDQPIPNARITQSVVEILSQFKPDARVTQSVVEILSENITDFEKIYVSIDF